MEEPRVSKIPADAGTKSEDSLGPTRWGVVTPRPLWKRLPKLDEENRQEVFHTLDSPGFASVRMP